jgi:hypothetical protein
MKNQKSILFSRLRASFAGLTFAVAAIVGAVVPAIDAAAATKVTNVTATWDSSNRIVEIAWNGTGVNGDTYTVNVGGGGGGMSGPAKDVIGADLTNLSTTSAFSKDDMFYTDGSTRYFWITTKSTDNSTVDSSAAMLTIGQTTGSSPHASAPQNVSVRAPGYNLDFTAPAQSGTSPITGWSITVSLPDGSAPSNVTDSYLGYIAHSLPTYSFVNGQTYKVTVAAINGADGVSPNSAETTFVYTGGETQTGTETPNNTTPDAPAPAPKAPKTGFTLGLSNPIAVIGIGTLAAAILFILGRKLVRR